MGLTKSKPLEHRRELTATKKMCNIAKDKSIGTFPSKPSAWVDLLLQRISVYAKEHPRLARNHAQNYTEFVTFSTSLLPSAMGPSPTVSQVASLCALSCFEQH